MYSNVCYAYFVKQFIDLISFKKKVSYVIIGNMEKKTPIYKPLTLTKWINPSSTYKCVSATEGMFWFCLAGL